MPWMERRMATLAASLWKCRAMSSLPCASSTLNSGASLMHAIFSISAEPLLRLRWSRVLKNALHVTHERLSTRNHVTYIIKICVHLHYHSTTTCNSSPELTSVKHI